MLDFSVRFFEPHQSMIFRNLYLSPLIIFIETAGCDNAINQAEARYLNGFILTTRPRTILRWRVCPSESQAEGPK